MNANSSYDEVLYPGYVHPQTHPDRLRVLGTLFGMKPAAVENARVLELACGQGSNLIPIANCYPDAQCLGIDLSERQITAGGQLIHRLGLTNVELRAQSITDFPADSGEFDYVIAHGVFSWVPEDVREKILAICGSHLAPDGVAIVSYNTYPGWHQRRMIRDMMLFHTRSWEDPAKRIEQAKAFLTFMTKAIPEETAYGKSLHEEFRSLSNVDAAYLFHEQLEAVNEPVYFHQFAELASRHQLQYVSEVELSNLQLQRYPPQVAKALSNMDVIEREQYLDFLTRRTFRQTLLCRREVKIDRDAMLEQMDGVRVSSLAASQQMSNERADPSQPLVLHGQGGVQLTIRDGLTRTAFVHLARAYPGSIPLDELLASVRQELAGGAVVIQSTDQFASDNQSQRTHLLQAFIAGIVDFHFAPPGFTTQVAAQPVACPLAQEQAKSGNRVTTRLHRSITLDPLTRELITRLDGSRDADQLLDDLVQFVGNEDVTLQHEGQVVADPAAIRAVLQNKLGANLEMLGRQALLIQPRRNDVT